MNRDIVRYRFQDLKLWNRICFFSQKTMSIPMKTLLYLKNILQNILIICDYIGLIKSLNIFNVCSMLSQNKVTNA